jgi:hypothetical protein
MTDQEMETLLAQAIEAHHVDVPVYRTRVVGSRVELHLYGGRVLTWPPYPEITILTTPAPAQARIPLVLTGTTAINYYDPPARLGPPEASAAAPESPKKSTPLGQPATSTSAATRPKRPKKKGATP